MKGRELFREARLASPYLNDFLSFEKSGEPSAEFDRS